MNWEAFIKLIQENTSQTYFFANTQKNNLIGETISALLNTEGGRVIIGYDKINVHLTGFDQLDPWIEEYIDTYFKQTELKFSFLFRSNKKVLIIEIEPSSVPIPFKLKFFRVSPDNQIEEYMPDHTKRNHQTIFEETVEKTSIQTSIQEPIIPEQQPIAENIQQYSLSNHIETTETTPTIAPIKQEITQESTFQPEPITEPSINNSSEFAPKTNTIQAEPIATPIEESPVQVTPQEPIIDTSNLNKRQKNALNHIKKTGSIKNKTYRKLFGVSHKTAHIELAEMVQLNMIQSSGSGRSTCYILKQAEQTNNHSENTGISQLKFNLIESYIQQHTIITETIYAEQFNVDLAKAIEELEVLCNMNILEQTTYNNETCYRKASKQLSVSN